MRLMSKVSTAIRGASRELVQTVVDGNSWLILEQEIHEYEQALLSARRDLTRVVAERLRLEREAEALRLSVLKGEKGIAKAMEGNDEAKAQELAGWAWEKEQQEGELRHQAASLRGEEQTLTRQLRGAIRQLQGYQRELRLARARQHAQQLAGRLAPLVDGLGACCAEVRSSLERIHERHQQAADLFRAEELLDEDLAAGSPQSYQAEAQAVERQQGVDVVLARVLLKGTQDRAD